MAKETVPNLRYTDEFKLEALQLAESVGIDQAAKRLGYKARGPGQICSRAPARRCLPARSSTRHSARS